MLGCVGGQRPGSGRSSRSLGTWPTPRSGPWAGCGACWPRTNPELAAFDQEALAEQRHYLELDVEEELARLEELRRQHLAELEALDGSGWARTGRHGEHGELSVELYETHVAAEEVDHLAQIARLR